MTELKPYPEYKDSGVEWIGEIPEGWNVIRLKHLTNYSLMYGANESAVSNDPKLPRYIRITDIDEYGNLKPDTFKSLEYDKAKSYLLEEGDILFARSGATVGKSYLHKGEVNACYAGYLIRFKSDTSKVLPEYIYYYTQSRLYKQWIQLNTIQATIENVSAEKYSNLFIPLPNKKHQRKIISYLDNEIKMIDKLMSFKSTLIKLLEEKRQAVITETVTKGLDPNVKMKDSGIDWIGEIPEHWDIVKLKFIGDTQMGLLYSPNELANKEKGRLVLRASNIQNSRIDLNREDNVYVDKEIPERLVTQVNDILICARSGSRELIGKSALINNEAVGKTFGAFTTVFRSEYNDFVSYVFQSGLFQSQIGTYLTSTINQLTISNLRNLKIVLPPRKEQEQLVSFLNKYDKNVNDLINLVQEQVSKLKKYRESLIYEAVTGKIDLRDYECDEEISEV